MTDPRDAMLNAARALHERAHWEPRYCATCGEAGTGESIPWPCPTALALGATGRSEWETPQTIATPAPARCGSLAPTGRHCSLKSGHVAHDTNNHQDTDMNQWNDAGQWWSAEGDRR